jgi:hypothetical protein
MSRISKPYSTFGIVASAAASGAMTAYNIYRARKAEREHPPAGEFVTVDGVRLHYNERGEGPPVVLLHGNVVTADDFNASGVLDLIAKRHRVMRSTVRVLATATDRTVRHGVQEPRLSCFEMPSLSSASTVPSCWVTPGAQP